MSPASDSAAPGGGGPERSPSDPVVLVVEDEASVRSMLSLLLRRHGFEPVLCADGEDAIAVLESGDRADVVLTDVRMPRMGGVAFVERLRADGRWQDLPVIAMSAYNDEQQEQEIVAAGASAFLPKPFTVAGLVEAISSALASRRA